MSSESTNLAFLLNVTVVRTTCLKGAVHALKHNHHKLPDFTRSVNQILHQSAASTCPLFF